MAEGLDSRRIAPLMSLLWSPMAAVTSHWQGKLNAQIAVAISAASIVPARPRLLVQIYKGNHSHELIHSSGALALNFLRRGQIHLIQAFGLVSGRDTDKLAGLAYRLNASGSPILDDCWAYLDCRVVNAMDGGDMTCFLVDVLEGDIINEEGPLWWRDARREMPPEWLEEWDSKITAEIEVSKGSMDQISYASWMPRGKNWA